MTPTSSSRSATCFTTASMRRACARADSRSGRGCGSIAWTRRRTSSLRCRPSLASRTRLCVDEEPEPPPLTDATYNLWMVDLEDVDVEHVREVWIHTVRSEGDTHVRGRWVFHPQRWLDVGPATVEANGVDFSYGSIPLATDVRGSFGATVHPVRPATGRGTSMSSTTSPTTGNLDRPRGPRQRRCACSRRRAGSRFTRWEGPFDVRVVLDHGKLSDGTHVSFGDDGLRDRGGGADLRGADSHRARRRRRPRDHRHSRLRSSDLAPWRGAGARRLDRGRP